MGWMKHLYKKRKQICTVVFFSYGSKQTVSGFLTKYWAKTDFIKSLTPLCTTTTVQFCQPSMIYELWKSQACALLSKRAGMIFNSTNLAKRPPPRDILLEQKSAICANSCNMFRVIPKEKNVPFKIKSKDEIVFWSCTKILKIWNRNSDLQKSQFLCTY